MAASTSAPFTGVDGHTYRFFSVATDHVGHVESQPIAHDAQTNVVGKPWQNSQNNRDSTNDGVVVPQDVLVIINEINGRVFSDAVTGKLNDRTSEARFFYDVNGDGFATPNDALNVINFLNSQAGEGEATGSVEWILDVTGGVSGLIPSRGNGLVAAHRVRSNAALDDIPIVPQKLMARQWIFAESMSFVSDKSDEESTESDFWDGLLD